MLEAGFLVLNFQEVAHLRVLVLHEEGRAEMAHAAERFNGRFQEADVVPPRRTKAP